MTLRYYFEEIMYCEMCGDPTTNHKVLGQRLNQSQGLSPRKKTGITVSVKKCTRCNLIYSSPQPIPFDIQDHYGVPPENYWSDSGCFQVTPNYFSTQINRAHKLLSRFDGMTALDVGAGFGKCMMALENSGFDAYGLEPSNTFYERAISQMKINPEKLKLSTVENADYPNSFFDFITFGAVFEHLYHPAICLEKAITWLKIDGIIHIEVPSSKWLISRFANFYFRLCGTNYVTNLSPMHVPFHLYEFDLKSFEFLGKRLGFYIEEYKYDVCDIPNIPGITIPIFRKYMEWTNTGMQLTIYLRKDKSKKICS